jgi:hypothetical protein
MILATVVHLMARQMGQGSFVVKHRAEIAHVEPAFQGSEMSRPERPIISVEKVSSNTAL